MMKVESAPVTQQSNLGAIRVQRLPEGYSGR